MLMIFKNYTKYLFPSNINSRIDREILRKTLKGEKYNTMKLENVKP